MRTYLRLCGAQRMMTCFTDHQPRTGGRDVTGSAGRVPPFSGSDHDDPMLVVSAESETRYPSRSRGTHVFHAGTAPPDSSRVTAARASAIPVPVTV